MDSDNDYGNKDFLYDPKFPIKKTKISKVLKVPKSYFQSQFSMSKIHGIFSKKNNLNISI